MIVVFSNIINPLDFIQSPYILYICNPFFFSSIRLWFYILLLLLLLLFL